MSGCCPGAGGSAIIQAKQDLDGLGGNGNMNTQVDLDAKAVRMEYFGPRIGAVTYHGKRKHYRFGNNTMDRYDDVNPEDVEMFLGQPNFRVIGEYTQADRAPDVDFIPEPAGDFVPEPAGKFIPGEVDKIELPDEGIPPALDIEPLPGTVKEIKSAVMGADLDTLLAWLRDEQTGKNRKTALEAIEGALEGQHS